ncbi:hypothetical protein A3Q56_07112 [Intoshia linei]|uniref:C1q domain-containing protein n=1 Tax=Intoshia linei TaxID=1819745 RepID=A0A177AVE4_9BILA|nr:hypothetical protein A3Q56_07112 [Intoshia linei]
MINVSIILNDIKIIGQLQQTKINNPIVLSTSIVYNLNKDDSLTVKLTTNSQIHFNEDFALPYFLGIKLY